MVGPRTTPMADMSMHADEDTGHRGAHGTGFAIVTPDGTVGAPDRVAMRRGIVTVLVGSVCVAAAAGGLVAWDGRATRSAFPAPWWVAILIAAGYVIAERHVFHVEYRREAMSFSLSEVPTIFSRIAFLGPIVAIAMRVAGSVAVMTWSRRSPAYKVVLNSSLFAFETAWAITVTRALTDAAMSHPGGSWSPLPSGSRARRCSARSSCRSPSRRSRAERCHA